MSTFCCWVFLSIEVNSVVYGLSENALVKDVRGDVAGVFDEAQLGAWPDFQLKLFHPWECRYCVWRPELCLSLGQPEQMKWYSSSALIIKWPHVNFLLLGISVDRGQQRRIWPV